MNKKWLGHLYAVDVKEYGYAGIIARKGVVIAAAPLLRFMENWSLRKVDKWVRQRNGKLIRT